MPQRGQRADRLYAQISREEYAEFERRFQPILRELAQDSVSNTELVDNIAENAASGYDRQQAITDRDISRYGLDMTPIQASQIARSRQLGKSLTIAGAQDNARLNQQSANLGLQQNIAELAVGAKSSGLSGLGNAASLEAQRNATNAQIDASNKAAKQAERNQRNQTLVSAGLLAAALIPW